MKKIILILALALNSAVYAQDPKYANPKTLNMECELATIYGKSKDYSKYFYNLFVKMPFLLLHFDEYASGHWQIGRAHV